MEEEKVVVGVCPTGGAGKGCVASEGTSGPVSTFPKRNYSK